VTTSSLARESTKETKMTRNLNRHLAWRVTLALLLSMTFAPAAHAQATVTKIVSGFPPGGGVDLVARLLADQLAKQGSASIVENKTGAGGIIAVQSMLTAPADGTVLLVAPDSSVVIYPHTVSNPGFDPGKDLAPIAPLARYDLALSVSGANPRVKDFASFMAAAKKSPANANFASPAAGSLQHFYGLSIGKAAGINLLHVSYRGVGPAVTDTISGIVGGAVTPVGAVIQYANAGNLRIVATSGTERGHKTPQVPTFKELGYPQLVARGWFGLFAPAKTPPETLQRIGKLVETAMKDPEFQARLTALDMEPAWVPAAQFGQEIAAENRNWAQVIQASGFRADN
jgi:tripartite-type tricarboxylate transporter receptor subunit TctC